MADFYRWEGDDLLIRLHVQPRASRNEIDGVHDGALKVRITAPPVDGKANQQLQYLLADTFGVARGAVELTAGEGSRRKTFRVREPARLPANISRVPEE
jgi:uncharacterized protein (TIGR00251 family)